MRSVRSTRAEPYSVSPAHLQNWTLVLETANNPTSPLLAVRPPRELAATLFRQLFTRHAESFSGPTVPAVALVLRDEFTRSFAGALTGEQLLELARARGLEAPLTPRCMGYRRESAPGVTRQLYYVLFDESPVRGFRQALSERALPGSGFDVHALSPVMFVAASDENFGQWLPVRAGESDCVAPISVESQR
jgi:hypothetical protein